MLFDTSNITADIIANDCLKKKQITVSVLRLDKINPVVSGNKLFKLHYFLEKAKAASMQGILTFGGAYSNHLVATAFACKTAGLKSVGFVRGEKPPKLSHTLLACIEHEMQLHYISREEYDKKTTTLFLEKLLQRFNGFMVVPEGGYHPAGANGAALITGLINKNYTHICTALGTATTFAGLLKNAAPHQQVIGVPVLKGVTDTAERIDYLTGNSCTFQLLDGYHFGGYAKKTPELINFMNQFYRQHNIPTDFVYTAKMMFAIFDAAEKDFFIPGSNILCLHTGGLQGNLSLPVSALIF
jgi:1-aminocyclopropane-1-carboxylate deaminase